LIAADPFKVNLLVAPENPPEKSNSGGGLVVVLVVLALALRQATVERCWSAAA
jgi:hypothetical protein